MRWIKKLAIFILYLAVASYLIWPILLMPEALIEDKHRLTEKDIEENLTLINSLPVVARVADILYSPGELHKSHKIPGLTCNHCHQAFQRVNEKGCRDCHRPEDFTKHSTPLIKDTHVFLEKENCLNCHWEHKGVRAKISVVFDETGHKTHLSQKVLQKCYVCHAALGKASHPSLTEEGMEQCYTCHSPNSWKGTDWAHRRLEDLNFIDTKAFTKILTPLPADACTKCHENNFHGEKNINKSDLTISGTKGYFDCVSCHNFSKLGGK